MSELKPHEDMLWAPTHLLDPGETAIWWGKPDPMRFARRGAAAAVIFGIIFMAMSAVVISKLPASGQGFAGLFSLIFCGGFFIVGAWIATTPHRRFEEAKTMVYLLTNRRALIAFESRIISALITQLKLIETSGAKERLGDVLFLDQEVGDGEGGRQIVRDGFIGIADAEAVAREMRRLQAAAP